MRRVIFVHAPVGPSREKFMQQVYDFARERGISSFDEFMNVDTTDIRSYRTIMPDTLRYSDDYDPVVGFGFALSFPQATQGFTRTVNGPENLTGLWGRKQRSQLKGLLRDSWGVHNAEDFYSAFDHISSGADPSAAELGERAQTGVDTLPGGHLLLPPRVPNSLAAWDLRRLATLAYIGCSLEWASVEQMSEVLADIARSARREYASWREFNEAYHVALALHSEGSHAAWMDLLYMNYFERVPESPWLRLEF